MTLGLTQRGGSLPAEVTGFVGRREELTQLADLMAVARLITVTGPGGVGKTRLALRAAAEAAGGFQDGVCLAELSGLTDPELLAHTVAASLGLPQSDAQLDAVLAYLNDRKLLLILDTCEHLLDACAMLADAVLRGSASVTVLATSRQPLDVPGEHNVPVPPLPAHDAGGDAVELFAQRAATVVPGFTVAAGNLMAVVAICRRLDGIPLAIELATVRLRALSLDELAGRLESRFRVLSGGLRTGLPRHQTLRTTIEWSYDLCTPAERTLWARLSVFAGSFGLAAAEAVCADDTLDRDDVTEALIGLVDKSVLLREQTDAGPRYRLLDTLREFGAERLAKSGGEKEFRIRHLARLLAMAEYFDEHAFDGDQLPRYRELRQEHADIRAALESALTIPGHSAEAERLATALADYWVITGSIEAKYWLDRVLDRFPGPVLERARALTVQCYLNTPASAMAEEGIALAERLGDPLVAARGYLYIIAAYAYACREESARLAASAARERLEAIGDRKGLCLLDAQLAEMHALAGQPELALGWCERGLRRLAATGEVWLTSHFHSMTGIALFQQGKLHPAERALCQALGMKAQLGDMMGIAVCLEALAWIAARQRRHHRVAWLHGAAGALLELGGGTISDWTAMAGPHREAEQAACQALGPEQYDAGYRLGAASPLDQLIAVALSDADTLAPLLPDASAPQAADPLSRREREIAALVADGLSNRGIAERLTISKRTVDAHVEHIYTKLGISSRIQLSNWLRS